VVGGNAILIKMPGTTKWCRALLGQSSQRKFLPAVVAGSLALSDLQDFAGVTGGASAIGEDGLALFASLGDDSLHSLAATSRCGCHDRAFP